MNTLDFEPQTLASHDVIKHLCQKQTIECHLPQQLIKKLK